MKETGPELMKDVNRLIETSRVITLATASGEGPWAAPVYYIYHKAAFWFFSKEDSRHIREAIGSGIASAAICSDGSGWEDIRGLQMTGQISAASTGLSAAGAFNAYIKRFDFIRQIKKAALTVTDIESLESAFRVRFYRFTPDTVIYTDNTVQFGFRKPVSLT